MEMNLWTLFSALVFPCQPGGVCMGAITNLKQQEVCEGGAGAGTAFSISYRLTWGQKIL